jgi:hypothetical protein
MSIGQCFCCLLAADSEMMAAPLVFACLLCKKWKVFAAYGLLQLIVICVAWSMSREHGISCQYT